jgi:iron complex transport system substrate-binding protein
LITALALLLAMPWDEAPSVEPQWLGGARPKMFGKVVTVAPSLTELLFSIGLGDRVVAVSRYDDYPPEATKLPRIGGFLDPNVEAIVGQRPDLVLAVPNSGNRPSLERIAALGVPVYVVPGNTFADVFASVRAIGVLFGGDAQKRAEALDAALKAKLVELAAGSADRPRPKVVVIYGYDPLILAGPGSFADTMIAALGGINVVKSTSTYPQYSAEELLVAAPEVILDATEAHGARNGPWARLGTIPAVKNGRVHQVPLGSILRPGPRLLEGLELVARLLQGARSISK